eukprot:CAMPEP_0194286242 /NCGR_PEP_ID=MMETSP0169-20130528/32129_1 /TAXON_ID=218684 /ORGANISM="Corethron pennatum, Strain L29A3" /LENGTH=131 /DNA_ID=CAMNT_0039032629 /DNA_START=77 /DNA_END=469 /DNA_ORIENTATION=+
MALLPTPGLRRAAANALPSSRAVHHAQSSPTRSTTVSSPTPPSASGTSPPPGKSRRTKKRGEAVFRLVSDLTGIIDADADVPGGTGPAEETAGGSDSEREDEAGDGGAPRRFQRSVNIPSTVSEERAMEVH